jgi:hypothetical protein
VASPVISSTPPPVSPPPRRSIAGPVVLIFLGVLFLMGTMGMLEIHHLGLLFARYWPALLILWGVIKNTSRPSATDNRRVALVWVAFF